MKKLTQSELRISIIEMLTTAMPHLSPKCGLLNYQGPRYYRVIDCKPHYIINPHIQDGILVAETRERSYNRIASIKFNPYFNIEVFCTHVASSFTAAIIEPVDLADFVKIPRLKTSAKLLSDENFLNTTSEFFLKMNGM